jgi:8-oxo-dGTP pyrophosphatase MutT (NUDIX family)
MSAFDFLRHVLIEIRSRNQGPSGEARRAAVGVLLAGPAHNPSICFIRRARWASDPWSEHIGLPGGSRIGGESAEQALRRELDEEIGLAIADAAELTALPPLRIRLAGRERILLLDSFVHHLNGEIPPLQCGAEVAAAFWVPLSEIWDSGNLDYLALGDRGDTLLYPAIRIPQGTIFGITLRVLTLLSDQLGHPLDYLEEIPQLRRERRSP